jgi:hypothetical protein
MPVSNGKSILTAPAGCPQGSAGVHLCFFRRPHFIHRRRLVIRITRRPSTGLCTIRPQVPWITSEIAVRRSPLFSRGPAGIGAARARLRRALDESVAALDVSIQAQVLNLLADIRDETAVSYILISHDLAVVRQLAEEAIVLHRGEVVERGPTARILRPAACLHAAAPRQRAAPRMETGPPGLTIPSATSAGRQAIRRSR